MVLEFPCTVSSRWIYTAGVSATSRRLREATKEWSHCLCWLVAGLLYTICTSCHLFCVALDSGKNKVNCRQSDRFERASTCQLHFHMILRYALLCIGKAWEDVNMSPVFPNTGTKQLTVLLRLWCYHKFQWNESASVYRKNSARF